MWTLPSMGELRPKDTKGPSGGRRVSLLDGGRSRCPGLVFAVLMKGWGGGGRGGPCWATGSKLGGGCPLTHRLSWAGLSSQGGDGRKVLPGQRREWAARRTESVRGAGGAEAWGLGPEALQLTQEAGLQVSTVARQTGGHAVEDRPRLRWAGGAGTKRARASSPRSRRRRVKAVAPHSLGPLGLWRDSCGPSLWPGSTTR